MLGVPLWAAQAGADELWLVELEHSDGIRLQFQGAELELGTADLRGVDQFDDLRPGMQLAIQNRYGVKFIFRQDFKFPALSFGVFAIHAI